MPATIIQTTGIDRLITATSSIVRHTKAAIIAWNAELILVELFI